MLIDEAHLVPPGGNGMYRRLLDALCALPEADVRVCGFTATPFRLDSGRLDEGEDRLFDDKYSPAASATALPTAISRP